MYRESTWPTTNYFIYLFFLAAQHSLWDLSFPLQGSNPRPQQ